LAGDEGKGLDSFGEKGKNSSFLNFSEQMRIAFIGQKGIPATYGGIENFTEEVATRLVLRGHEVTVYCRPNYTKTEGEYRGVFLKKVKSISTKHLDALSHTFLSGIDSSKKHFDVINFQALGPATLSFIPRLSNGTKIVNIIHALDWKRNKWSFWVKALLKLAEFPSILFPHKVVVISTGLKKYFEKKGKKEVIQLPTGVEEPVFRKPNLIKQFGLEKNNFILYLGRLVPEKGCHYLIEAFLKIKTEKKLFIAGDGTFTDGYLEKLHKFANNRIIFGGLVEKEVLEELFSNACLYVLPSEVEGLPHSVLQALSYGLTCLVSDIPENREAASSFAVTFKSKDVADLKEKLELLLQTENLAKSQTEERKKYIEENFNWDKTAEVLEEVYQRICSKNGGSKC
jgi:glycosyltransferase involved in cell wall biosynthesis